MGTKTKMVEGGIQREVPSPGEMLREEFIEPGGLTETALARALGWTVTRLNQIVQGKRAITAESAIKLAAYFRNSPEYWLHLQDAYDLDQALMRTEKKFRLNPNSIKSVNQARRILLNHAA